MREAGREEGRDTGLRYMPALDGLRALAVIAVLLYHGDVSWAEGGYLGVDAFFVLSGFLITSLLAGGVARSGTDRPQGVLESAGPAACSRRSSLVLAAVAVYAAIVASRSNSISCGGTGSRRSATSRTGIRSLADQSYFEQFAAPSALRHTWSLAIEEQFYLVWPLVVLRVAQVAARLTACAVHHVRGARGGARRSDGGAVRARTRSVARLLRHRHACAVAADRRNARGARDARRRHRCAPRGAPPLHAAALVARRRCCVDLGHDRRRRRLAVPRRVRARGRARRRSSSRASRSRAAPGRCGAAVVAAAACDRPHLLRALPVALADLRVARARAAPVSTGTPLLAVAPRRDLRRGRGVVRLRRAADPARIVPGLADPRRRTGDRAVLVAAVLFTTAGGVPSVVEDVSASELVASAHRKPRHPEPTCRLHRKPTPRRASCSSATRWPAASGPASNGSAAQQASQFWDASVPGCGLASDVGERWFAEWRGIDPKCLPGWRERWPRQIARSDPDVVVVLFGAQDAFDRRIDRRRGPISTAPRARARRSGTCPKRSRALLDRRPGHAAHDAVLRARLAANASRSNARRCTSRGSTATTCCNGAVAAAHAATVCRLLDLNRLPGSRRHMDRHRSRASRCAASIAATCLREGATSSPRGSCRDDGHVADRT